MKSTGARVAAAILVGSIVLLAGCQAPTDQGNNAPYIERITATPDTVFPGGQVNLQIIADDPDVDSLGSREDLSYEWVADGGSFLDPVKANSVWNAPINPGQYTLWCYVSDSLHTVYDSVFVWVSDPLVVQDLEINIVTPEEDSRYSSSDQIEFLARINDFGLYGDVLWEAEWRSDVDGLLDSGEPDSSGNLVFRTSLTDSSHVISLTVTADNELTGSDTVRVSVFDVASVELYPVERSYSENRLSWSHQANVSNFIAFSVVRYDDSGEQELARFTDPARSSYVDSAVVIGRVYEYEIRAEYDFGLTVSSGARSFRTGVYTGFTSSISDLWYDEQTNYVYLAAPEANSAYGLDVSANNLDRDYWFVGELAGDDYDIIFSPWGFAYSAADRILYTSSPGDSAIWRIHLDQYYMDRWVDRRTAGTRPQLMDYQDSRRTLFVASNNRFPFAVRQTGSTVTVTSFFSSEQIANNSKLIVDNSNELLYLSELGSFPASLWKYDITTTPPTLLLEDTHNSLGYLTRDIELLSGGQTLLMAGDSPHQVQRVSTADFTTGTPLQTGPLPTAIWVSPDGSTAYIAVENWVQIWDLASDTMLRAVEFEDDIIADGLLLSSDESIWMLATSPSSGQTDLFIVYQ